MHWAAVIVLSEANLGASSWLVMYVEVTCEDQGAGGRQQYVAVFQLGVRLWLFRTNYQYHAEGGANCIFFNATSFHEGGLNFTYNKRVNGTWKHVPHVATYITEKDPYYEPHENRTSPNSIWVLKSPGNPDNRTYRLIYSGSNGCSVFRVPGQHNGMGCMVVITDDNVSDGMDQNCTSLYDNACGKYYTNIQVFNNSCKIEAPE
nr:uncharacterized protein LOC126537986 [Dermacentor andersoni]